MARITEFATLDGALAVILNPGGWFFFAAVASPLLALATLRGGVSGAQLVAAARIAGTMFSDVLVVMIWWSRSPLPTICLVVASSLGSPQTGLGCSNSTMVWTKQRSSFSGRFYQLQEAECDPIPVQQPKTPVWIGAAGHEMLHVTAHHADVWNQRGDGLETVVNDVAGEDQFELSLAHLSVVETATLYAAVDSRASVGASSVNGAAAWVRPIWTGGCRCSH